MKRSLGLLIVTVTAFAETPLPKPMSPASMAPPVYAAPAPVPLPPVKTAPVVYPTTPVPTPVPANMAPTVYPTTPAPTPVPANMAPVVYAAAPTTPAPCACTATGTCGFNPLTGQGSACGSGAIKIGSASANCDGAISYNVYNGLGCAAVQGTAGCGPVQCCYSGCCNSNGTASGFITGTGPCNSSFYCGCNQGNTTATGSIFGGAVTGGFTCIGAGLNSADLDIDFEINSSGGAPSSVAAGTHWDPNNGFQAKVTYTGSICDARCEYAGGQVTGDINFSAPFGTCTITRRPAANGNGYEVFAVLTLPPQPTPVGKCSAGILTDFNGTPYAVGTLTKEVSLGFCNGTVGLSGQTNFGGGDHSFLINFTPHAW